MNLLLALLPDLLPAGSNISILPLKLAVHVQTISVFPLWLAPAGCASDVLIPDSIHPGHSIRISHFITFFKGELEAVFLLLISLFYNVDVADVDLNEIISATQHWKHHPTILQRKCVSWEIRLPFSCCTPFLLFCNETDFLI